MHIQPSLFVHVYNQGNNKQKIFFEESNYIFFLQKVRKHLPPFCDVLGYCLMPNHFHFLIYTNHVAFEVIKVGAVEITRLSNGLRIIESSYTQAINKRLRRSGSLFRQKAKQKFSSDALSALGCLNYIHQNPLKAGLVKKMEDWRFSSFRDYLGLRNGTLSNLQLARQILPVEEGKFYKTSYKQLAPELEDEWL